MKATQTKPIIILSIKHFKVNISLSNFQSTEKQIWGCKADMRWGEWTHNYIISTSLVATIILLYLMFKVVNEFEICMYYTNTFLINVRLTFAIKMNDISSIILYTKVTYSLSN